MTQWSGAGLADVRRSGSSRFTRAGSADAGSGVDVILAQPGLCATRVRSRSGQVVQVQRVGDAVAPREQVGL